MQDGRELQAVSGRELHARREPAQCGLFVVGWLPGGFGAALAAAGTLSAAALPELPAIPVVTVALAS